LSAGLCPDPLRKLTALPRPLAGFNGTTSKEGKERGGEGGEGKRSACPYKLLSRDPETVGGRNNLVLSIIL